MAEVSELKPGVLVEFQVRPYKQKPFYARGRVLSKEPWLSSGPYWAGYVVTIDMTADKKYLETFSTQRRTRTTKRIERVWVVPGGAK